MDVVGRIRALMQARKWTRYRLEQESGLSKSTISNFFSKRGSVPTLETLEPIVKAFGMTLSQFFAEGDEPVALTAEQRALLDKWDRLSREQQEALQRLMDTMHP